ncbi:MAG: sce7726 family protein [Candidatus Scalindua sp.]|nr:sce7726 family protein [Candidatus Scalindua sp.]
MNKRRSEFMESIIKESNLFRIIEPGMSLGGFYDSIYKHLLKTYRNEYIYKNAIAEKILLGKHSLNTSFMLTEFRTAECKADTVVLNGTSNVYEIKSEFDSLDRLQKQIKAYQKVFDLIHIITSPSQLEKVEKVMDSKIGIMVLTERNTIKTIREPKSGRNQVQPMIIFDSLRKVEYVSIIRDNFGFIPDVPNTLIYKKCKALFCKLSPEVAHDSMVKTLKKRGNSICLKEFILGVPDSLKAASLTAKLTKNQRMRFREMLEQDIESYFYS